MGSHPVRVVVCFCLISAAVTPVATTAVVRGAPGVFDGKVPNNLEEREYAAAVVNIQIAPETDNTITRIAVHENGTATWTVKIRTRLVSDEAETEYRAFQARFRNNSSEYVAGFRESILRIIENAESTTGREMHADKFRSETSIQSIPRRWGIVTFEFQWEGFALKDGNRLLVGDVFEGGLFIAEGDSIEVAAPQGYHVASADPAPDETGRMVFTWHGREDFADQRPRVVIVPDQTVGEESLPWFSLIGATTLLAMVLAGFAYRKYQRDNGTQKPARFEDESSDASEAVSATSDQNGLMADEDLVLETLEDHGGRMRQKTIGTELEWSRSKTSRVLGRMEEDGTIRKLRLGRENVIAFPEEDEN